MCFLYDKVRDMQQLYDPAFTAKFIVTTKLPKNTQNLSCAFI